MFTVAVKAVRRQRARRARPSNYCRLDRGLGRYPFVTNVNEQNVDYRYGFVLLRTSITRVLFSPAY